MQMQNLFNSVKQSRPGKNVFDLTHDVKLSLDMGPLVPIMIQECVPGDKFQISCDSLIRFSPLISPVMHRMDVTMHYFFVPNRILWPGWEDWIMQKEGAGQHPYFVVDESTYTPLLDYMGVPTPPPGAPSENISALPIAAYAAIYNEYYRDQNLIPETDYVLGAGNQSVAIITRAMDQLKQRAWEHDYFTAALPFAQAGGAVDIPLGTIQDDALVSRANTVAGGAISVPSTPSTMGLTNELTDLAVPVGTMIAQTQGLEVEPTTINDLRRAFRLQEWLEKNARGGRRYIESILSHFGVRSSDKRLQRPEYITGTKSPVIISEILNTTGETDGLPQGNMAGHAISVTSGKYGSYFCEEHGYIIGIMSVLPKTAYQQGIPKHFTKYNDPFKYYWPSFANIGEQAIENREIYAYQGFANGNATFGYVPRYAEYKYSPSRVAGEFKTTLDFWHMGRIFSAPPALNAQFISSNPTKRIFAVEGGEENKLYAHVLNKVRAVRPMPKYGTPTF